MLFYFVSHCVEAFSYLLSLCSKDLNQTNDLELESTKQSLCNTLCPPIHWQKSNEGKKMLKNILQE